MPKMRQTKSDDAIIFVIVGTSSTDYNLDINATEFMLSVSHQKEDFIHG